MFRHYFPIEMKSYLGCVIVAMLVGGCVSVPQSAPPLVLENTGTEFPAMCMLLQADGRLVFRGGFAFYNPSSWRKAGDDVVVITLGGKEPFPSEVFKEQLPKHAGGLLSFDEKRREVTYRFNDKSEFLNFGNYYFYRAASCHAQ